jgi:hypothetical protein
MSGAASSIVIQNIAVKAIKALKKKGAIVTNIFCDRHHYKGVQRLFGVSGEMEHVTNYIKHPNDPNLFQFLYVPHIMKCIRNHIFTHKYVQLLIINNY